MVARRRGLWKDVLQDPGVQENIPAGDFANLAITLDSAGVGKGFGTAQVARPSGANAAICRPFGRFYAVDPAAAAGLAITSGDVRFNVRSANEVAEHQAQQPQSRRTIMKTYNVVLKTFIAGAIFASMQATVLAVPTTCQGLPVTISGSDFDDANIQGTSGDDVIHGGAGNDIIRGNRGNDVICGGNGVDDIEGESGDDQIKGGSGDDVLSGNEGHDTLSGDDNNDDLNGGDGQDVLDGGPGFDDCNGGLGNNPPQSGCEQ